MCELPGQRRSTRRLTRFMKVEAKMKQKIQCGNVTELVIINGCMISSSSAVNDLQIILFCLCFCMELQHGLSSSRLDKAALQKRNIYLV